MRGTLCAELRLSVGVGIIPAHAGNTLVFLCDVGSHGDHPRACGEHGGGVPHRILVPGSSPRMRGTLIRAECRLESIGIIPAHAGNTRLSSGRARPRKDHPRACGEHFLTGLHVAVRFGIIPAHAGNTAESSPHSDYRRDHPRACGEHHIRGNWRITRTGSSPRMRGTHLLRVSIGRNVGIIPAHAGNTRATDVPHHRKRDHPRACGEHVFCAVSFTVVSGSSPRMRGTRTHK